MRIIKNIKAKYNKLDRKLTTFYYKVFHKLNVGSFNTTMYPSTGKGQSVSVYRKGDIIQIIDEEGVHDEIRIIPVQYNHGIMIERLRNGSVYSRNILDIEQLNNDLIYSSNLENLIDNNE